VLRFPTYIVRRISSILVGSTLPVIGGGGGTACPTKLTSPTCGCSGTGITGAGTSGVPCEIN